MPFLIVAVVFVGLLCSLNLILAVGMIRRLREHTAQLSGVGRVNGAPPTIDVGEEVGDFTTTAIDGESLERKLLTHETLVAFFSPGCRPCREKLPKFVEYSRSISGGRNRVLAVVVGETEETGLFVTDLSPVARVAVEDLDGPLSRAFKVTSYPTMLTVAPDRDNRLVVTANHLELLRPFARA
ncbi:TlpA family protein disulfide reductase [Streptosporangium canum]|uniref:TlpA family protein disulfide reductase n=1 Tax=Streptosporangium canum TaxID=324952 RepID=UPI0034288529